ncbi:MAG: helicase [Eubacterium callanderi]
MIFTPHEYQKIAIQKVVDSRNVGLFLEMGL